MKNIILFDSETLRGNLLPLTFTRPIAELRIGILTIKEKWERWLDGKISYMTEDYLSEKYPIHITTSNYIINASLLPNPSLILRISRLAEGEAILYKNELLAARLSQRQLFDLIEGNETETIEGTEIENIEFRMLANLWDIYQLNDAELRLDFDAITKGRMSEPISQTNQILGDASQIFLEKGAKVECCVLNATTGPIYFGQNSEMMEGSVVRGALALCEGAVVKLASKIYGATTIGPHCRAGGEINNSVMLANSNKGHDGFLGNSVLGEWCNIGADSNNSNLKNNYDEVKLWHYPTARFAKTGLQFCGLVMGDHSKCGINTMFNTGTVVGVSANVFGGGYPRNFIPSFAWGGSAGFETYLTHKAFDTAQRVVQRRGQELTELDKNILQNIFEQEAKFRTWEKTKT